MTPVCRLGMLGSPALADATGVGGLLVDAARAAMGWVVTSSPTARPTMICGM
jgi:hypothetical protein